jgi:protease I
MNLKGKRVAILIEQQYQELEVWYPLYRLREAGCQVVLVGPEVGKTYPSKLGYPAVADLAADQARASDFDAVIAPGGFAPDYIRRYPSMIRLVREMNEAGKLLAAICHGPWVLCSTPALRGKKATAFYAIKDDVINAGATWTDEEVVVDGNVITSRKPDDLPAFVLALMEMLSKA